MLNDIVESQELSAAEFVAALEHYATSSPAVDHRLLADISEARFVDLAATIRRFFREYYFYSRHFTQYLALVMSKFDRPDQRIKFMPNAMEEGGHVDAEQAAVLRKAGIEPMDVAEPHPVLFHRFLEAIGCSPEELANQPPHIATTTWIQTLLAICQAGGPEQAIGALGIGTEAIVRPMYRKLVRGVDKAWPQLSKRDRVFFDLHILIDDDHADVMRDLTGGLCGDLLARRKVAAGVMGALNARRTFLDEMHNLMWSVELRDQHAA